MSTDDAKEKERVLGIVQSVLTHFNKHQLPRVLDIKQRVDSGEQLTDADIELLDELLKLSSGSDQFVQDYPEYAELIARAASLYHEITEKALQNEKNGS